jgi:hypothetical protein
MEHELMLVEKRYPDGLTKNEAFFSCEYTEQLSVLFTYISTDKCYSIQPKDPTGDM